jgi:protein ImuB
MTPPATTRSAPTRSAGLCACLLVREFPVQAMLRLRPALRNQPVAVLEGEPPLERVCSLNVKAAALGVARGMTRAEMETFPSIALLRRSCAEEAAARAALLECAGRFSPRVEESGIGMEFETEFETEFLCVADIAGTARLFGAPEQLGASLLRDAHALGVHASLAISGNSHAAVCAARGMALGQARVIPPGEEISALAPLPLSVLDLAPEHAETLALWGIATLGRLAELPEKDLIARLGQEGARLRRLARGELPHLLVPVEPAFSLEERIELDAPVELLDSLLFVLGVLLDHLIARAAAHIFALASVTVELALEGRAHRRTVRPALPSNDRALWLKLLHLDLQAHPPDAAILSVALQAEPGSTRKVQLGLFSPQLPEPARLDVTLARIRAIVGEGCVGRAVLRDTHRPDAFAVEPFRLPPAVPDKTEARRACCAQRRLRPAEAALVTLRDGRLWTLVFRENRYVVEQICGPWLGSGGWWSPAPWQHEQWDVTARAQDGAWLCCCLARDRQRWQIEALYD